jgi:beta-lactamase regulating signal transducer with metallopeptidase domain/Tfp pilus assembly protein PilF
MTFPAGILSSVLVVTGLGDVPSLLVRVTLIAAAGILLCSLLRHASAAKRHLAAIASLVALLAFPAAKVFLPVVSLPVLPAATAPAAPASDRTSTAGAPGAPGALVPGSPDGSVDVPSTVSDRRSLPWSDYVILIYLIVYATLLLHVLASFLAAAVMAGRARRIDDSALRQLLDSAREQLRVSRAVDIRESSSVTIPVVWGLFRPVLVLPVEARGWTRERLRVVFLHEMAHVARYDGVSLLLARIATSVFWFHPLVWELARVARRECERCCDDLVLASGQRATDYAEHLLAIVRSMSRQDRFADVAPALARRSNLESRLTSILRADQRRDSVSRSGFMVTIGLAGALLVAITALHLVAAPARARIVDDPVAKIITFEPKEAEGVAAPVAPVEEESPPSIDSVSEEDLLASAGEPVRIEAANELVAALDPGAFVMTVDPSMAYSFRTKSRHRSRTSNESGLEYMRDGQYTQAITAFEKEIKESGSVNSMYNLACAYSLKGDKKRAFEALQNAIENGFNNTHHMQEDDDLQLIQGDPHFYQLVRLSKDLQLFGSGRFGGMDDEDDWRKELPRLERVTREHPDIGRAWSNLGYARLESGDAKGATAAYERALGLEYQKPTTLYNLACCAARSGSADVAFGFLDRADKAGFEIGEHMGTDTDLDALRGDPRYKAMLDRWDEKMAKEHREKEKAEEQGKMD